MLKEYLTKQADRLNSSSLGYRIRIEEDVIHLKISCQSLRERALLEFLYSTGCRVGTVEKINLEDLNWENCSAIVNSKGSKQREVYFTTECKVWLKKYMASREDSLFVTDTHPTKRMAIPTIRWALKRLADRGEIEANVYPHFNPDRIN